MGELRSLIACRVERRREVVNLRDHGNPMQSENDPRWFVPPVPGDCSHAFCGNFETGFRGWQFAQRSLCRMLSPANFAVPPRRITYRQTREAQA
jgi:hypothetical protein